MADPPPFSPAADRNKEPILEVFRRYAGDRSLRVLEVGSGTGQHAVHFAAALPALDWQTGDLAANHPGIRQTLRAAGLPNVRRPVVIDAEAFDYSAATDLVYTANTFHIMSWPAVRRLLAALGRLLQPGGRLMVYGPFNVGGRFTSDSNAAFDASLRAGDSQQGIRGREEVCRQADACGFSLLEVVRMPANNQVLVFERRRSA